jgi:hypothetical protein
MIHWPKNSHEINHVVANHAVQISERSQAFCHTVDQISQHFVHAQQSLDELRSAVCDQIATAEAAQYQTSQLLYEQEMIFETTDYILSRRMTIDADSAMTIERSCVAIYRLAHTRNDFSTSTGKIHRRSCATWIRCI